MRTFAVTRLKSATSTLSPRPSLSRATCSVKGKRLARHAWNPLPALRNSVRCPASRGRLVLEESGERAPDQLVGQALLAGADRARGAQRRRVRLTDERSVVAGAAHRGGEVPAETATQVAEDEPVVARVQAVRQSAVETRQPGGRQRPRPVGAPRAHAVQEGLHAGDVSCLTPVTVALEDGVRPLLDEVGEEVLDHRVGAAPIGPEQHGEDVAGHGAGRRRAQGLAGAGPVHTRAGRAHRRAPGSSPPARRGRRSPPPARGCRHPARRRGSRGSRPR